MIPLAGLVFAAFIADALLNTGRESAAVVIVVLVIIALVAWLWADGRRVR